ncbi:hypothetical protein RFI_30905 [Reticulomyxa filosa]|uniref:Uncharacterized protein n=1 Tax=Reticulomyxa filosa TaxID=46433 RepID=X6LYR4_RETFI|nr:hypothetical protein RFI_30905 [Reticulomyxa filosa]|eukprot:ETO06486.1 hypothetical protein RFI_30905 [Reticulomyxa filosa]
MTFLKFIKQHITWIPFIKYGIRPSNKSAKLDTTVFDDTVNANFVPVSNLNLNTTDYTSIVKLNYGWQQIKRPLLLDVSSGLTKTVDQKKNRWYYLKNALPVFGEVLEDYAVINISCFSSTIIPCSTEVFNPNSTGLLHKRKEYQTYIDHSLFTSSQKQRSLFKSLIQTYHELNVTKAKFKELYFFFFLKEI